MFSSYLIPLSSVDEDTLAVGAVVGIAVGASVVVVVLLAVVAVLAVTGFARWWKGKHSGTYLARDVSMECSKQTAYCVLQEFVHMAQDPV